jgi:hypothetical protein
MNDSMCLDVESYLANSRAARMTAVQLNGARKMLKQMKIEPDDHTVVLVGLLIALNHLDGQFSTLTEVVELKD